MIVTSLMLAAMQIQSAAAGHYSLDNPGAELGSLGGWTVQSGSFTTPSDGFVNSGTYAFATSASGSHYMYQDLDVDPAHITDIDAGNKYIKVDYYAHNRDAAVVDAANMYVDFYNGTPGTLISSGKIQEAFPSERNRAWRQVGTAWVLIPPLTRTYRVYIELVAQTSLCDTRVDDITVSFGTLEFADMVFSNPGAETGNFSGWTDGSGPYTFGVDNGTLYPSITGKVGTYFFYTLATSTTQNYDHVGTLPVTGGWDTDIDLGLVYAQLELKVGSNSALGTQGLAVDLIFLTAADVVISTASEILVNGVGRLPNNTFRDRRGKVPLVPATTRKIKVRVKSYHNGSNRTNMWDDLKVKLVR